MKQIRFHLVNQNLYQRKRKRKKSNFFIPSPEYLSKFNHLTHSQLGKVLDLSPTKIKNLRRKYIGNIRWKTEFNNNNNNNKTVLFINKIVKKVVVLPPPPPPRPQRVSLPTFKQLLESISSFNNNNYYLNHVPNNWN